MEPVAALGYLERLRKDFEMKYGRPPSSKEEEKLQDEMLEVYYENQDSDYL